MELSIYTDGGSKGNPGPSAIGLVIYAGARPAGITTQKAENELVRYREDIGHGTNNEAEYTALIRALEIVAGEHPTAKISEVEKVTKIMCHADSELMVKQLNGLYKVKNDAIRQFVFKIRVLESQLRMPITFHHIRREQNVLADALVNDADKPV